jgi:hypothetical protein
MIPLTFKLENYEGPNEPFALRVEGGIAPPFAKGIGRLVENSHDGPAVCFEGGRFGLSAARLAPGSFWATYS